MLFRAGPTVLCCALLAACLPSTVPLLEADDAGPPPSTDLNDDAGPRSDVDLGDAFALVGLEPSHGPWTGGTRTVLAGRGFTSQLRVLVGVTEVPAADLFASDPTRAAIATPSGAPGSVSVTIVDDATKKSRTLAGAFHYDAFAVTPASGATSGGTHIALHGLGTAWAPGTTVSIDAKPCLDVVIGDATHLECTTAAALPGTRDVTVTNLDSSFDVARDAFAYSDSSDGFRGGLSGGALSGTLKVIALDSYTGNALPGAKVIVGTDVKTALIQSTTPSGVTVFSDPSLKGLLTVTVAGKCLQPTTFVDVPVDTVTAYIDPVLDPTCGTGDLPLGGGKVKNLGLAQGELVWPTGVEFQSRGAWVGVPVPVRSTERRVAYVFAASSSADANFYLPEPSAATTMDSDGKFGYAYQLAYYPGNVTLYALAGIEDSAPPRRFQPYIMGVQRGVPLAPNVVTTHVDIKMETPLDHAMIVDAKPPASNGRGPDRLISRLAVTLGQGAYALLPVSPQTKLLPNPGLVAMVGIPALAGALSGESYLVSSAAVTGPYAQSPLSALSHVRTSDANVPLAMTGFMPLPVLASPGQGSWSGREVSLTANATIDLVKLVVSSAGGGVSWTIVSPGKLAFALPDLAAVSPAYALVKEAITTQVQIARINSFSYAKLRYGQLYSSAFSAYASDTLSGVYAP